jgi:hypothetical protein
MVPFSLVLRLDFRPKNSHEVTFAGSSEMKAQAPQAERFAGFVGWE